MDLVIKLQFLLCDVNANVNVHKSSRLTAEVRVNDGFNGLD